MAVVGIGIGIRIRIRIGVGTGDVSPILGRFFLCFLVFNAKPSENSLPCMFQTELGIHIFQARIKPTLTNTKLLKDGLASSFLGNRK